ncbi:MAG: protein-L-isoaspartate(D-aspartate) O-methyltransferase [Deltaproteobacteria bacterium]|nr:protein-L-isoaspartate(D-aspartate) O-methyltransferase [Deltaproteobacteria bacterium]MBI4224279.1 protein-L-isoaspartate(D-aspartate) O-methyltransferase [Deltaproteobacteria bacterium]
MITEQLMPGGVKDPRVLEAMGRIPRHRFVQKGLEDQAYLDRPLTIGQGQTISQPLIVGMMTQALALTGNEKVLEIGTGSGYQAAILAELAREVYTVERLSTLSIAARRVLYRLGYHNIEFKIGDGTLGWQEKAPFDAILVTAAGPKIPETLKEQMAEGGRMILPVGSMESQELIFIKREGSQWKMRPLSECRFVKLVGEEGWSGE